MSAYIILNGKSVPLGAKLWLLALTIAIILLSNYTYDEELQDCLNAHPEYMVSECRNILEDD